MAVCCFRCSEASSVLRTEIKFVQHFTSIFKIIGGKILLMIVMMTDNKYHYNMPKHYGITVLHLLTNLACSLFYSLMHYKKIVIKQVYQKIRNDGNFILTDNDVIGTIKIDNSYFKL